MTVEKLAYFKVGADVIEEKCKGITFVFTIFNNLDQFVGTLFAEDGDPLALRMKSSDVQIYSILTPVDIYPSLGLMTYKESYTITHSFK
jgi:hypothetical protein